MLLSPKFVFAVYAFIFSLGLFSCKKCVHCNATDPSTGELMRSEGVCDSKSYVSGFKAGFIDASQDSGWTPDCVDLR